MLKVDIQLENQKKANPIPHSQGAKYCSTKLTCLRYNKHINLGINYNCYTFKTRRIKLDYSHSYFKMTLHLYSRAARGAKNFWAGYFSGPKKAIHFGKYTIWPSYPGAEYIQVIGLMVFKLSIYL